MIREKSIEEIYDGRFYGPDDEVPVGCRDCEGCSECCRHTGDSILLDPCDMFLLEKGTGKTFSDLLERQIEVRLVDGLYLPNLLQYREGESGEDGCPFLSAAGRCTIHPWRPGFCRLYPMGRYYTEDGFFYILQKDECRDREKTPVLLRDWLGVENLPVYEAFVLDWHAFKKRIEGAMERLTPRSRDSVRRYIVQIFFAHPYLPDMDFYTQYRARMEVAREALGDLLSMTK